MIHAGGGGEVGEHAQDVELHDRNAGPGGGSVVYDGRADAVRHGNEVRNDLMRAAANYDVVRALPEGNEYEQTGDPLDPDRTIWNRLGDHLSRNKIKYIFATAVPAVATTLIGVLSWYFSAGPGQPTNPMPQNDTDDNVPRGPGPVDIDVLANDINADNATINLVGADSSGVYTETGVGTWSVTNAYTPPRVRFTPDPTYDFSSPATAQYTLTAGGVTSAPATITITYAAATPPSNPNPSSQTVRGDYANAIPFNIGNASGNVQLVTHDPGSPSTLTVAEGVWKITGASTVQFTADATFTGDTVNTNIQVNFGATTSSPATLTVLYNQPVAGAIFVQSLTPGLQTPAIDVVVRSYAIPPNTLDPTSVKLAGLQDMEMSTNPTSIQLSQGGKNLAVGGQGVWMVSDDGHVQFVPNPGPALVASYSPGADRSDFTGFAGLRFTSAANQTISSLGIRMGTGDTGTWTVSLTDAMGNVLASAAIDLTGGTVGTFYYGTASYQLTNGTTYYLVTEVDSTQSTQYWSDAGAVTLNSAVATDAVAVYSPPKSPTSPFAYTDNLAGDSYVGLDFTVVGFTGSPTPALYTIADNKGNTSTPALIILNYGTAIQPTDLNDPNDTTFFANLQMEAFNVNPPLAPVVLLATLTIVANATATILPASATSVSPITDLDARYATYTGPGTFTANELWNACSDIDATLVDPKGTQVEPYYARYWRLTTMQELLSRLVVEMQLT